MDDHLIVAAMRVIADAGYVTHCAVQDDDPRRYLLSAYKDRAWFAVSGDDAGQAVAELMEKLGFEDLD